MRGEKGKLIVNGTPTQTPTSPLKTLIQPIKLNPNDTITISANNTVGIGTSANYVSLRFAGTINGVSNNNIFEVVCTTANAKKTFTVTQPTIIRYIMIRGNTNITFNNFILKPQLELNQTATSYEPHQGKELPLDLPVENLFYYSDNFVSGTNAGITVTKQSDGSYTFIGTATSTGVNVWLNGNYNNYNNMVIENALFKIPAGKTITVTDLRVYMVYEDLTKKAIVEGTTLTLPQDAYIMAFRALETTPNTTYNKVCYPQLEISSKANAYTPYGTDPIELCKIGNYQDYFYKSGSKWYLHKEVEKVVLDGSEGWTKSSSNLCYQTSLIYPSNVALRYSGNFAYSTHYKYAYYASSITSNIKNGEFSWNGDKLLTIGNTEISTLSDFQTWLAVNNPKIYYPLIASTNTEITNTTLISQLEAIYNAPLYEQTNITQTNNDLPMVLDITACKDNINGIKAFIRK